MDAYTIRINMLAGISVMLASCATENFLSDVSSARLAQPTLKVACCPTKRKCCNPEAYLNATVSNDTPVISTPCD